MRRTIATLLACSLGLAACGDDRVTLSYGTRAGRRLAYRLALTADIDRTLSGQTRRQVVEASFRAEQEVVETLPGGEARARMTLRPESLVVDGRAQTVGSPQEFLVTLGEDGRIVEIGEPTGAGAEPLEQVGIERLLPRLRPVLPGHPVSPGDSWRSESEFEDEAGRFSLSLRSRLAALGVAAGRRSALVRTTYASPVARTEIFANAVADIDGRDVGTQEAWFALDGFLVRASGDSVGRYRVVFRPPGGETGVAPVEGALRVRLHTDMGLLA